MISHARFTRTLVALAAACAAAAAPAASLLDGFGGPEGFGAMVMEPNDDGSSNLLDLPFAINFFGTSYSQFYVNNNGNISFNSPLWAYTPTAFPVSSQPMIAPWWADVDTRGGVPSGNLGSNAVYVASPNADTAVITWHNVGYFSYGTDKLNSFQLVLRNRADTGAGNFDFDFRYNRLEWTTGSASGGSGGLGGVPAQAGYDDGQQVHYYTLPGSQTANVLDLVNLSNVSAGTPGLWTFAVRNGITPGTEPSNPLLPVVVDGAYTFDFNIQLNQQIFVDPLVAVGYDYQITGAGSPLFQSVLLPNVGDGEFTLFLWDGVQYVATAVVHAGDTYTFAPGGVARFRIGGIETEAGLDPANTSAFVTGLTFSDAGSVQMTQTPLTVAVPEPATWALWGLGLAGLAARRRRATKA